MSSAKRQAFTPPADAPDQKGEAIKPIDDAPLSALRVPGEILLEQQRVHRPWIQGVDPDTDVRDDGRWPARSPSTRR